MDRRTFIKGMGLAILAPSMMAEVIAEPKLDAAIIHSLSRLQRYEYAEFQAAMMRAIAESMGMPYNMLTMEFEAGYSASKTALINESVEMTKT